VPRADDAHHPVRRRGQDAVRDVGVAFIDKHFFHGGRGLRELPDELRDDVLALELLTKTDFDKGLVAGVPSGTLVAHKFGEKTINTVGISGQINNTIHELHDCGIIYIPNDPYFLCVMTKGNDFETLASVIKDISGIVWKQTQVTK
jgi:hypothetical protein